MSRLNIILVLILFFMLAWLQTNSAIAITFPQLTPSPSPTVIPTPTAIPIGKPVRFIIPKLHVDAPVIQVGTDETGKMILPQEWDKVGWYSLGYKPGETGNAVIAGHLDSTTGAGAIFYYLWQLVPGDTMYIVDENGRSYTFTVVQQTTYPYDQVPIDTVFGPSSEKMLDLITCTGTWNPVTHNYSHRRIVTAEMSM